MFSRVLDPAILETIGPAQTVLSYHPYGDSAWSSTARITTGSPDGSTHDYFAKIVIGKDAEQRVNGEYACMSELYKTIPSAVPAPRGSGRCRNLSAHFFVCDFLEIDHRMPNAAKLGKLIAGLHEKSQSPTGQFGFHVTPYDGKLPLVAEWDSSWTSFFGKLLRGVYLLDIQVNGLWRELDDAMRVVQEEVIARLLAPLEADGRSIKPCLIHGDLWEANLGTDLRTGDIYMFDSCAYYAHHEMGVAMWRCDHHHMKARKYRDEYFTNYPMDEPVEEYDDRARLYSLKEMLMYSAHVPGSKARSQALADMLYLIERFAQQRSIDPTRPESCTMREQYLRVARVGTF